MKKEKYSIVNLLDNNAYKKYDYAYKASNNNYSIIYLFSNDNDLINESYEKVKNSIIKSGIINNKIDLTVKKFSKYSVYDNKNYQVVIKNDKSIIFTTTDIKNKKDIDKLLKELNYDYSELSSIFLVLSILIFSILYLVSLFKLFKKSGRNPFLSLIPIYNLYIYADISVGNKKLFFLFLIPIVNIFMFIYSVYKLSKLFGKNTIYALTSSLLCFIYFPLLAFDDSEYLGVKRI